MMMMKQQKWSSFLLLVVLVVVVAVVTRTTEASSNSGRCAIKNVPIPSTICLPKGKCNGIGLQSYNPQGETPECPDNTVCCQNKYFFFADLGSTKTQLKLYAADGSHLGDCDKGAGPIASISDDQNMEALAQIIQDTCKPAIKKHVDEVKKLEGNALKDAINSFFQTTEITCEATSGLRLRARRGDNIDTRYWARLKMAWMKATGAKYERVHPLVITNRLEALYGYLGARKLMDNDERIMYIEISSSSLIVAFPVPGSGDSGGGGGGNDGDGEKKEQHSQKKTNNDSNSSSKNKGSNGGRKTTTRKTKKSSSSHSHSQSRTQHKRKKQAHHKPKHNNDDDSSPPHHHHQQQQHRRRPRHQKRHGHKQRPQTHPQRKPRPKPRHVRRRQKSTRQHHRQPPPLPPPRPAAPVPRHEQPQQPRRPLPPPPVAKLPSADEGLEEANDELGATPVDDTKSSAAAAASPPPPPSPRSPRPHKRQRGSSPPAAAAGAAAARLPRRRRRKPSQPLPPRQKPQEQQNFEASGGADGGALVETFGISRLTSAMKFMKSPPPTNQLYLGGVLGLGFDRMTMKIIKTAVNSHGPGDKSDDVTCPCLSEHAQLVETAPGKVEWEKSNPYRFKRSVVKEFQDIFRVDESGTEADQYLTHEFKIEKGEKKRVNGGKDTEEVYEQCVKSVRQLLAKKNDESGQFKLGNGPSDFKFAPRALKDQFHTVREWLEKAKHDKLIDKVVISAKPVYFAPLEGKAKGGAKNKKDSLVSKVYPDMIEKHDVRVVLDNLALYPLKLIPRPRKKKRRNNNNNNNNNKKSSSLMQVSDTRHTGGGGGGGGGGKRRRRRHKGGKIIAPPASEYSFNLKLVSALVRVIGEELGLADKEGNWNLPVALRDVQWDKDGAVPFESWLRAHVGGDVMAVYHDKYKPDGNHEDKTWSED